MKTTAETLKKAEDLCPLELRQYVRRPDRAFWMELFTPVPVAIEQDRIRRERLTRYSIGAALVLSLFYGLITAFGLDAIARGLLVVNLSASLAYAIGMWMASLGKFTVARCLLMSAIILQVAAVVYLTGDRLGTALWALVAIVLARTLFAHEELPLRATYITLSVLVLVGGTLVFTEPRLPVDELPPALQNMMRVINLLLPLESIVIILTLFQKEVRRSEQSLTTERERSDRLLHAVLPVGIANQLRERDRMIADRYPEVTVLFADIAGFTPWASQQEPEVVVGLLEKIFTRFDARVQTAGAEKIKTIGDAYMVISGAPDPCHEHARVMALLALELRDEVVAIRAETGIPLDLRIGLHTGPVIGGVIGAMRFTYDVWGDTVNTASRMESHGEPGRIHLSSETRAALPPEFVCHSRGTVYVKGKGEMETWWLEGVSPAAA